MEHNDTFVRLNDVSFMFKRTVGIKKCEPLVKKGNLLCSYWKIGSRKKYFIESHFRLSPTNKMTSQHIAFLFQDLGLFPMANGTRVRFNAPETKR